MHSVGKEWSEEFRKVREMIYDCLMQAAAIMLARPSMSIKISLTIGEEEFCFSGDCPDQTYKKLLENLGYPRKDMDLTFSYDYASGLQKRETEE